MSPGPENGPHFRYLRYFLATAAGSLMYSTVVGRYRLPGTAVLLLYAAAAVHWAGGRIARREWRALALAGVAGVGIMLVSTNLLRAAELRLRYPPREYSANAVLYYERGQIDEACGELRRGLEKAYAWPDHTALPPQYTALLVRPYVSLAHTLHRDGERIQSFAKAWNTACQKAGYLGKLVHDLRRTGVRNLIRAGVPQSVAMKISGHKTRAIFDRYHIVSERRLKQNAQKLAEHLKAKEAATVQDGGASHRERVQ